MIECRGASFSGSPITLGKNIASRSTNTNNGKGRYHGSQKDLIIHPPRKPLRPLPLFPYNTFPQLHSHLGLKKRTVPFLGPRHHSPINGLGKVDISPGERGSQHELCKILCDIVTTVVQVYA